MKVLIVGLGSIATKHIKALRDIDEHVEILAWRQAKRSPAPEGVEEVQSLEGLQVDFAIVSNPTSLHLQTITQLLPLDCPLFIEKPLSHDLEGVSDIIDAIDNQQLMTYMGCNLRFLPTLQFLKEQLPQAGKINEVTVYCGSYLPDWRPHLDYKTSYSAIRELGGGVHLDLIHELDYCYWLFGMPSKVHSFASNVSHLNIEAHDGAYYHLVYKDFLVNVSLNYFRRTPKRTVELVLENDTWLVDLLNGSVTDQNGTVIFQAQFDIMQTYKDQMIHFLTCIQSGVSSMNTIDDGYKVLRMCLAEL